MKKQKSLIVFAMGSLWDFNHHLETGWKVVMIEGSYGHGSWLVIIEKEIDETREE